MSESNGIRWRTLGRHVSWLTGRIWSWGASEPIRKPVFLEHRYTRQATRLGVGPLVVWIDWERGHNLPPEPNILRRWITGRA